jgi:Sap, sulfolipid-1-addressing protein
MWGSVLGLALLTVPDPLRFVAILLLISRPRPVQNLLVFWVGCLIVSFPLLLVPLMVLHFTPMFGSFAHDLATPATSSTVRHIQIGFGVLALSAAALMTVRLRVRQRANLPKPRGNKSILLLDSNTPTAISRPLGRAPDAATKVGSAIRRLLGRAHDAWENGSVWVALVLGLTMGPAPDIVLLVLAIIVTSGAAIHTQVTAAIVYIVGVLAVVEIMLVSYLVVPAKTEAVLRRLHDWALTHRQQVLIVIFAVIGLAAVARGTGVV